MRTKFFYLLFILSLLLSACGGAATPAVQEQPAETQPVEQPAAEQPAEAQPAEQQPATEQPAAEQPAEQPAEAQAGEPVTLRVMVVDYVADKTDKWLEEEVVPAFQAEHPNVNVEFIYVNWGTLDETIAGYFAAGDGADIINLGSEYIAQYGDQLAPLNEYLGEAAWPEISNFAPGTLDTVTWKGELRGLPWLTAPRAYMCRMDLLNAAGIETIPTTFDEWLVVAKDATVVEEGAVKQAGLVTTGRMDDWQEYVSLIWGLGSQLYKEDGTPNFDTPEAKAALQFMYDRRRGVYADEMVADLPEPQGSRLADGSAACLWANMWGAPPADDPIWESIELTAGPVSAEFPNSKPVSQVFNDWLAVPAYSKNVETAAEFLKFLGSAENLFSYNQDFGSFPPREDAWQGYVSDTALMKNLGEIMSQHGMGFADIRQTAQFREILQRELPAFFTDMQDIDTTLTNIQEQYTQALSDAGLIQ